MGKFYSSRFVEANPRYQEALRRQQAKELPPGRAGPVPRSTTETPAERSSARQGRGQRSATTIIADIAQRHRLTPNDLTGESRQRHIVEARFDAIAAIYTEIPLMSLAAIGRALGGRHSITITHALKVRGVELRDTRPAGYRDIVLRLHRAGRSVNEIVDEVGCAPLTVFNILRRERLKQASTAELR